MKKVSFALLLMLTGCGLLNSDDQVLSEEDCILQNLLLTEGIANAPLLEGETIAERDSEVAFLRLIGVYACTLDESRPDD